MTTALLNHREQGRAHTDARPSVPLTSAAPYAKDVAASAAVLGFMSIGWLSWGMAFAPGWLRVVLIASMVVAGVVGSLAVGVRSRDGGGTRFTGAGIRSWWLWLAVEVVAIVAGGFALTSLGQPLLVICWAHLVMALHFVPLARTFAQRSLVPVAVTCAVIAVAAAVVHLTTGIVPGAWVGALGGGTMLLGAIAMIGQARRLQREHATVTP